MQEYFFENKTYYRTNEWKPDQTTVVFVHGVCGSSSAFWEFEKKLDNKYNILTYDLRGHGLSKRYREYSDYKIENFSKDLLELIEFLRIKKFVIISHSFGTFVALDFIQKHQELITGIIFLSPHYNASIMPKAKIVEPFLNFLSKMKFPMSTTKKRKHLDYLKDYPNTGDFNLRRIFADVSNTSLRGYLYVTKQAYKYNGENILKDIKVPTLIIHGKADTIFPVKWGILMSEKIQNAKIVLLENVCHELKDNMTTITKISDAMEGFLKKIK